MKKKTKIAIVGMGGVGGFWGGMLAHQYENSSEVEIYFIARGTTLENIKNCGLKIDTKNESFVAKPRMVTADSREIGVVDYLIYATKAYDVISSIENIQTCIDNHTVILPFLNGLDSTEKLRNRFPQNEVWDGCVYIVSYIVSPGHIAEDTNGYKYLFGYQGGDAKKITLLAEICQTAKLNCYPVENSAQTAWNKFSFISTVATITSYTDMTYGEVLNTPEILDNLKKMIGEFGAIAHAKGIKLSPTIEEDILGQMRRIPAETTTSMQRDFRAHKTTELESLTGYIVRAGADLHVPTPIFSCMYEGLKQK